MELFQRRFTSVRVLFSHATFLKLFWTHCELAFHSKVHHGVDFARKLQSAGPAHQGVMQSTHYIYFPEICVKAKFALGVIAKNLSCGGTWTELPAMSTL